jgi:hypothetical protein
MVSVYFLGRPAVEPDVVVAKQLAAPLMLAEKKKVLAEHKADVITIKIAADLWRLLAHFIVGILNSIKSCCFLADKDQPERSDSLNLAFFRRAFTIILVYFVRNFKCKCRRSREIAQSCSRLCRW